MENLNESEYFDLTSQDIIKLRIERLDRFNCRLIDEKEKCYKGFILSRSRTGKALTLCDIDFHKSATDGKYQPRLVFRKADDSFQDKLLTADKTHVRIPIDSGIDGYREFWKMITFLYKFKDLVDIGDFHDSYKVVEKSSFIVEFQSKEDAAKVEQLSKLFLEGNVSEDTIKQALTDTRKHTLEVFRKLLVDESFIATYKESHASEIKGQGEEAIWHHFLKKNQWILGLNIDVRFIRDLIGEAEVGIPDTSGSGSPKADILGISDYVFLVELKTPNTHIFTNLKQQTSRANTWSFSDYFIDGISQCLGQKSDWDRNHNIKPLIGNDDKVIDQIRTRSDDTKILFIIGNKSKEIPEENTDVITLVKRDTLHRFRRNSRNVEIVTYDELYEKSYYLVHNRPCEKLEYFNIDDIPF